MHDRRYWRRTLEFSSQQLSKLINSGRRETKACKYKGSLGGLFIHFKTEVTQ